MAETSKETWEDLRDAVLSGVLPDHEGNLLPKYSKFHFEGGSNELRCDLRSPKLICDILQEGSLNGSEIWLEDIDLKAAD